MKRGLFLVLMIFFAIKISAQITTHKTQTITYGYIHYLYKITQVPPGGSPVTVLYVEAGDNLYRAVDGLIKLGKTVDNRSDGWVYTYCPQNGFILFDLAKELGGQISKINSAVVKVKLYNSGAPTYTVSVLGSSILNMSVPDQIQTVQNSSGSSSSYSNVISMDIKSSIQDGKIIIGVKADVAESSFNAVEYCEIEFDGEVTVPEQISVTVKNNFEGGVVRAKVDTPPTTNSSSPVTITNMTGKTLYMQAVEGAEQPVYQNYARVWNDTEGTLNKSDWEKRDNNYVSKGSFSSSASTNLTLSSAEKNYSYVADMKRLFNITYTGYSSITVNGISYSSPTTTQIVEQNSITASAQSYLSNGVNFTFENWKKDGITYPTTFTPTDHESYNAVYRAKPSNTGEYVHFSTTSGQPIVVYWTDNTNQNVTLYKIYRKVKHNGVVGPETYIGSVSKGVGSFTDYDYLATPSYSDDLIWYDVRAFYNSTDPYIIGDYSDALYTEVYGKESLVKMNESKTSQEQSLANEIPTEYSIGNYPNPFNPTTTIKYQLPEAGMVTLKVYDILGREVAELVNENKAAGYYEVNFDASRLTSGVYIYTIQAGKYTESKKMILAK